jgi:prevent-host-death family protein
MNSITIKELHRTTGEYVRRAGASRTPIIVTDHGKPVAVLTSPTMLKPKRRKRVLVPGFRELMSRPPSNDVMDALNEIRGDR